VEQDVVQGLAPHFCGRNEDLQIRHNLILTCKILQVLRTDYSVQFLIFALIDIVGIEISRHITKK
jgi:hypothetical protein